MPAATASLAPSTISPGARSPPMASTAIGSIVCGPPIRRSGVDVDDDAVLVAPARRADDVRLLGVAAARARRCAPGRRASRRRRDGCGSSTSTSSSSGRPRALHALMNGVRRLAGRAEGPTRVFRAGLPRPKHSGATKHSDGRGALLRLGARSSSRAAQRSSRTAVSHDARGGVAVGATRRAEAGAVGTAERARQGRRAGPPRAPSGRGRAGRARSGTPPDRHGGDRSHRALGIALVDVDGQQVLQRREAAPALVGPRHRQAPGDERCRRPTTRA